MPQFAELVNKLVNKEMRCFKRSAFPVHLAVDAPVSVYPADQKSAFCYRQVHIPSGQGCGGVPRALP